MFGISVFSTRNIFTFMKNFAIFENEILNLNPTNRHETLVLKKGKICHARKMHLQKSDTKRLKKFSILHAVDSPKNVKFT